MRTSLLCLLVLIYEFLIVEYVVAQSDKTFYPKPDGRAETYTIPSWATKVRISMCGASGGDGVDTTYGGNGGFLEIETSSLASGTELRITVGNSGAIQSVGETSHNGGVGNIKQNGGACSTVCMEHSGGCVLIAVAAGGGAGTNSDQCRGGGGGGSDGGGGRSCGNSYPGMGGTSTTGGSVPSIYFYLFFSLPVCIDLKIKKKYFPDAAL